MWRRPEAHCRSSEIEETLAIESLLASDSPHLFQFAVGRSCSCQAIGAVLKFSAPPQDHWTELLRIGGNLWQYPTRFLENSPIFMADRVQTPLLLLHNDADDAVPWYQGIEYFLALRRLDKEVYLFNYNGELHGLRKRVNQKDYTVRMQQFFDHYLKGTAKPAWMEKGIPYLQREKQG